MTTGIGLGALSLSCLWALITGVAVFRPREGTHPDQLGISPLSTDLFGFFASLTIACVPALLVAEMARTLIEGRGESAEWSAHWGSITMGASFIFMLVFCFGVSWNNTFKFHETPTSHGGVIKVLGKRLRKRFLAEGGHRIPFFITVENVDMKTRYGEPIEFYEITSDKTRLYVKGYWEVAIGDPAAYLDFEDVDRALNQRLERASKRYVRLHSDDELTDNDGKYDMEDDVTADLRDCTVDFAAPGSMHARIEELSPPPEEVAAAAAVKAAEQKNREQLTLIEGFNQRLQLLKKDNPTMSEQAIGILLQAQEKTLSRKAFIFEGLEGSADKFAQTVGAFLRRAATTTATNA